MTPIAVLHTALGVTALATGAVVLARRKGDSPHRIVGRVSVGAMVALGAERNRISAAVGPCIHQDSYEVDDAFRAEFDASDTRYFVPGRDGHWQFDLPGYVLQRLRNCGISTTAQMQIDTYRDEARFHSYRRATHRGDDTTGRQFSLIALPN